MWVGLRITQERDANAVVTRRFLGGGFTTGASATPANAEKHFYTRDHLGSTRHVVTGLGSLAAAYDYSPYGIATKLTGTVNIYFLYTGHLLHSASGLVLAPYRALDPERGVWISRDPIKENGGLNLYAYVGNDPLNLFDPTGELAFVPLALAFIVGYGFDVLLQLSANGFRWECVDYLMPVISGFASMAGFGWMKALAALMARAKNINALLRFSNKVAIRKYLKGKQGIDAIKEMSKALNQIPNISNAVKREILSRLNELRWMWAQLAIASGLTANRIVLGWLK